jgi:DNA-binding transcriptional LysR family regulator
MLLQRNNKGFVLTREGRYFYERAKSLLEQADELTQMMCDMGNQRKRINLGIPPMIGTFLFPDMYKGFNLRYPEIMLNSREGGSRELLNMLNDSMLDFAILPVNQLSEDSYNIFHITETETVFCVTKDHKMADRKTVSISDIKDEPLIMFDGGFYQNQVIKERFEQKGLRPTILHYSSQFFTIKEFISDGIAAGFMFKDIAETVPEIRGISLVDPIRIEIGLVWKLNQHIFNDAARFLKYSKEFAESIKEKHR